MSTIRGLQPLVNLARLQIRGGHADVGRQRLLDLYAAVVAGSPARLEGVAVPADLTANDKDRHEVGAWPWRVLLADGTRALTTEGRWAEALAHVEAQRGVGKRMLDRRQVAVLAYLVTGDTAHASALLAETMTGDAWEQAVTACLTVLGRRDAGHPVGGHLTDLAAMCLGRQAEPGLIVFDIRLGLTVLDAIDSADSPSARCIVEDLYRRATDVEDGYAARENLAHPLFTAIATDRQARDCRALVRACALGAGTLPDRLGRELRAALRASDSVIRESHARASQPGRPSPLETA